MGLRSVFVGVRIATVFLILQSFNQIFHLAAASGKLRKGPPVSFFESKGYALIPSPTIVEKGGPELLLVREPEQQQQPLLPAATTLQPVAQPAPLSVGLPVPAAPATVLAAVPAAVPATVPAAVQVLPQTVQTAVPSGALYSHTVVLNVSGMASSVTVTVILPSAQITQHDLCVAAADANRGMVPQSYTLVSVQVSDKGVVVCNFGVNAANIELQRKLFDLAFPDKVSRRSRDRYRDSLSDYLPRSYRNNYHDYRDNRDHRDYRDYRDNRNYRDYRDHHHHHHRHGHRKRWDREAERRTLDWLKYL